MAPVAYASVRAVGAAICEPRLGEGPRNSSPPEPGERPPRVLMERPRDVSVRMGQVFHPATNTLARATVFGGALILAALVWFGALYAQSSFLTQAKAPIDQPVPFSHEHHVAGLGIDCRYCHTSVEQSSFAGMPPTRTCMNCHSQIWTSAPLLEPVRESFRTGKSLVWNRVNDLPDFVYFDHSIH